METKVRYRIGWDESRYPFRIKKKMRRVAEFSIQLMHILDYLKIRKLIVPSANNEKTVSLGDLVFTIHTLKKLGFKGDFLEKVDPATFSLFLYLRLLVLFPNENPPKTKEASRRALADLKVIGNHGKLTGRYHKAFEFIARFYDTEYFSRSNLKRYLSEQELKKIQTKSVILLRSRIRLLKKRIKI